MEPEEGRQLQQSSKRPSRRTAASRNYDETLLDDLFHEHLGPDSNKKRNRTLQEREKETETEAMLALSLGFPIDALLDDEVRSGVVSQLGGSEQNDYIVVRNHILSKWRGNVRSWLTKSHIRETVSADYDHLVCKAYDFLLEKGYINFGVTQAVRSRFPEEQANGSVVIVGAGLAGLSAARQLLSFGFKVLVVEARNRPGGRVYTQRMGRQGEYAAVDLGGSVITGIHANPLGVLARQMAIPLHKIRDSCPLYRPDGRPIDGKLDTEVETVFNKLLEQAAQLRGTMGDFASEISLGSAIEKLRRLYGVLTTSDEGELLNWHLANLEFSNAGCLSDLSLAYWDQDDPYEMDGDHCFLAGGNWRLIDAMCQDVPVLYGKTVTGIRYGDDGVEVILADDGQSFQADVALCTVPLGVLKKGAINFDPELPAEKLGAIGRLGFGLLNKVAMVFPFRFWDEDVDTFGCLNRDICKRGEFFLFYSYHTVSGGPVLIALVAGKAALEFERTDPIVMLHRVLTVLRGTFGPRGIDVPDPVQTICTRWGTDPLSYGSYSHIKVGSSGKDYDILAKNVSGRLFFAGEATSRQYPATMHGAFVSGLREASCILHACRDRAAAMDLRKPPSLKNFKNCCYLLIDMFKKPDLAYRNFSFVFDPSSAGDPKALGLFRLDIESVRATKVSGPRKQLNQESQQQVQDDPQLPTLHLYSILSREQAEDLQQVEGGDNRALLVLFRRHIVKFMGISCFCCTGSSLITSIANARKFRARNRTTDPPVLPLN